MNELCSLVQAQHHEEFSTRVALAQNRQAVHRVTRPWALQLHVIDHHVENGLENLLAHGQSVKTWR